VTMTAGDGKSVGANESCDEEGVEGKVVGFGVGALVGSEEGVEGTVVGFGVGALVGSVVGVGVRGSEGENVGGSLGFPTTYLKKKTKENNK
jgi:hypothetical protein